LSRWGEGGRWGTLLSMRFAGPLFWILGLTFFVICSTCCVMKFFPVVGCVVGLMLSFAGIVQAEEVNLDFSLVNKTGYGIKEVYISPMKEDSWQENILEEPLEDGETLDVTFSPEHTAKKWDLKIVWVDGGDSVYWRGCDLSQISKLTLFYDADTDETSAKAE
jgi:hypothetical protein